MKRGLRTRPGGPPINRTPWEGFPKTAKSSSQPNAAKTKHFRWETILHGGLIVLFIFGAFQNAFVYNLPTVRPCTFRKVLGRATEKIFITPNTVKLPGVIGPLRTWLISGGWIETCTDGENRYLLVTDGSGRERAYLTFPYNSIQPEANASLGIAAGIMAILTGLLFLQWGSLHFKKELLRSSLTGEIGRPILAEGVAEESRQLDHLFLVWVAAWLLLGIFVWQTSNFLQGDVIMFAWLTASEANLGAWTGGLLGLLLGGLLLIGLDEKTHPLSELLEFFYWGALFGVVWQMFGVYG